MNDMLEEYFEYLAEEGYRPHRDDSTDIWFKHEGTRHFFRCYPNDPHFYNLHCQLAYGEDFKDGTLLRDAANKVNGSMKAIKISTDGEDGVDFGIETLLAAPESFRDITPRALDIIASAVRKFDEALLDRLPPSLTETSAESTAPDDEAAGGFLE